MSAATSTLMRVPSAIVIVGLISRVLVKSLDAMSLRTFPAAVEGPDVPILVVDELDTLASAFDASIAIMKAFEKREK